MNDRAQGRHCGLLALLSLTTLALLALPDVNRAPWQDEAFLLHNLGRGFADYFAPLPLYDQAGPPLTLTLLNQFYHWSGGGITEMRATILGTMVIGLGLLAWLAVKRRDMDYLLALALIVVTPSAIRHGTEIKHYGFELLASLALVLAARLVAVQDRRQALAFALLALVLSFCSYTAMFVAGAAMLEIALFRASGRTRTVWLAVLAAYTAIWLAIYALLLRDLLHLQMANYRYAYDAPEWSAALRDPALLKNSAIALVRSQPWLAGIAGLAAVAGLAFARRITIPARSAIAHWLACAEAMPVRLFVILWVMLGALWLAGLFPFSSERVLLFTMPVAALAFGLLLRKAGERLATPAARAGLIAAAIVPALAVCLMLQWQRHHETQDTRAAYSWMKAHPASLYVPNFLFEPVLRYYREQEGAATPDLRIVGWLDPRSEPLASLATVEARLRGGRLNSHDWRVLEESGAEGAYARWVVEQALRQGSVDFVSAQVLAKDEAMLREASAAEGCVLGKAFSARGIAIFRINCPPRPAAAA